MTDVDLIPGLQLSDPNAVNITRHRVNLIHHLGSEQLYLCTVLYERNAASGFFGRLS
jgi:hypothetical protein